jgi:hypothetical protein
VGVSLHDAIAGALPGLRAEAEALMVDTVTVDRATGDTTPDPVTLEDVPVFVPVWSGKARVQRSGALSPRDDVAGGFEFPVDSLIVQAPLAAVGIVSGDRLTVTAVGVISDPDLVGKVATVKGNLSKTHATKRTLVCEEVG